MKEKTISLVLLVVTVLMIPIFASCNRISPALSIAATTENEEYFNPIDEYFLPKINQSTSEVECRDYQDSYRGVWKEEFYNVLQWLDSKCVYPEDREDIGLLKNSVEDFINEYYRILLLEQLDFYSVKPDERYITGNAFRSEWNQIQVEIYRDVCIKLITDDYKFLERDYSKAHFE
ncbi:MAG: hypothetical protein FWH33_10760 [Oscillospiraceae bacterium]|nr:hypothetical protein [Oscillospiraceae bacterium]